MRNTSGIRRFLTIHSHKCTQTNLFIYFSTMAIVCLSELGDGQLHCPQIVSILDLLKYAHSRQRL